MNKLWKILLGVAVVLSCAAWSKQTRECTTCQTANSLIEKIKTTQSEFLKIEEEHKKHNVQFGPTKERKAFELAQGEAYRFICDYDKNTYSKAEKKALINFVLDLNRMNIDSEAMFDLNGCFRAKVIRDKKGYAKIARKLKRQGELHQFVMMNTPTDQDYLKK